MTIDEAIKHFRIIEQNSRQDATDIENCLYFPKSINRDRLVLNRNRVADTNKQIAEWLEELKELREYVKSNAFIKCYNRAIDDAIEIVSAETHDGTLVDMLETLKGNTEE